VLLVTRLDHLARSTRDLLNILAGIVEKGAGFRWLSDISAGTTTALGRLMLTILGGLQQLNKIYTNIIIYADMSRPIPAA
jgi:DNA invertase Pin-like site-specific DNA recombinase